MVLGLAGMWHFGMIEGELLILEVMLLLVVEGERVKERVSLSLSR